MTPEQVLEAAHIRYEQGTDAPSLTEEDGLIRLSLLKGIVDGWGKDNNTRWTELYSIATIGPIVAGDTSYPIAEGFHLADSLYLQGSSKPLQVKKPWQITGAEGKYVYILGNPKDGYTLELGWTPAAGDDEVGKNIRMIRYREAAAPTAGVKLEMSDPWYAVTELTAELYANDDIELYTKWHNDAINRLANMRDRNDQVMVGEDTEDVEDNSPTFGE